MKIKVDKKAVLTGLSAAFGVGAFVVNVLTKKDEMNETAEKAAKIAMEKLGKSNQN